MPRWLGVVAAQSLQRGPLVDLGVHFRRDRLERGSLVGRHLLGLGDTRAAAETHGEPDQAGNDDESSGDTEHRQCGAGTSVVGGCGSRGRRRAVTHDRCEQRVGPRERGGVVRCVDGVAAPRTSPITRGRPTATRRISLLHADCLRGDHSRRYIRSPSG